MFANQAKFHLVDQRHDWERWLADDTGTTLGAHWKVGSDTSVEWNHRERNLRLKQRTVSFVASQTRSASERHTVSERRGADRDRYGVWYWIGEDQTSIVALSPYDDEPLVYWSSEVVCADDDDDKSGFQDVERETVPYHLSGLAVTQGHYLVVGASGRGVLIFDLHRGASPTLLEWVLPEGDIFLPFDLATTADGGVLILDRAFPRYWVLNQHFQLVTTLPDDSDPIMPTFAPKDDEGEPIAQAVQQAVPMEGYPLLDVDGSGNPHDFVSIERGPDGSVLVLNAPVDQPATVHQYLDGALSKIYRLTYITVEDGVQLHSAVRGYDMTYIACQSSAEGEDNDCLGLQVVEKHDDPDVVLHLLFVARADGNQVLAYQLLPENADDDIELVAEPDYLPLNRWQARAIVRVGGQVYYDALDQWFPLTIFHDCDYPPIGIVRSPIDFDRRYRAEPHEAYNLVNGIPEQPFDSNIIGCVWHRLMVDAELPPETAIEIYARANDDPDLLTATDWIKQPKLVWRSGGSELPYADPYDWRDGDATLSERHGTWEILLQEIIGRYIQLELRLISNTRSTPEIQALRVWYPRFSYPQEYLPAIYNEDPTSASFTERFLANYEGLLSSLEDKIVGVYRLMDARSAPRESLDWLAGWLGAVLHPIWEEDRRRFFIRYAHKLYKMRGTVPGIIIALRMFLDDLDELDERLFDLAALHCSKIRIVENFSTRRDDEVRQALNVLIDNADIILSNSTDLECLDMDLVREELRRLTADPTSTVGKTSPAAVAAAAHRFTVLFPHMDDDGERFNSDKLAMIRRIIELEKPAHTWFDVDEYWAMFRVGEARLGLDTQIGNSSFFQPLILGDAVLPNHYLGYPYPYNIQDRFVMERNQVQESHTTANNEERES